MKVGVSMYSYVRTVRDGRMDISGFIREAKRIGAEGVELLDFFYKDVDADRDSAMAALEETGLVCGVFSVANNFAKPDAVDREMALGKIRFGVDEAVKFGAKTVRVFSGDVPADGSISFESGLGWIIDGLTEAANYAHGRGVRLGLENHGKLAGRSEQVRTVISAVRDRCGHDALGANPDTGNFLLVGEKGEDGVKGVVDLAYMVHFKDFAPSEGGVYESLDGTRFSGTVIGEGVVDLGSCVATLADAGFTGWLNLEYEGEGDPIEEVMQSMANTKRFVSALSA